MMLHFINSCDKNCMFQQIFCMLMPLVGWNSEEMGTSSSQMFQDCTHNHIVKLSHGMVLKKEGACLECSLSLLV